MGVATHEARTAAGAEHGTKCQTLPRGTRCTAPAVPPSTAVPALCVCAQVRCVMRVYDGRTCALAERQSTNAATAVASQAEAASSDECGACIALVHLSRWWVHVWASVVCQLQAELTRAVLRCTLLCASVGAEECFMQLC